MAGKAVNTANKINIPVVKSDTVQPKKKEPNLKGMTKEQLLEYIQEQNNKMDEVRVSGWLVVTTNKEYNEKTHQVQFRNGRALVMDKGVNKAGVNINKNKVIQMIQDFGYTATYYEDLNDVPEFEQSLIDVMQKD